MPIFNFYCPFCGEEKRLLADAVPAEVECSQCCGGMARDARGPGARVVEKIDTGIMAKAVERLADGPSLIRERNKARVEADRPPALIQKLEK